MNKVFFSGIIISMVLGFSIHAHADLELLGQGTSTHGTYNLIYDTDYDITWYDYTAPAVIWQNQVDWASALSVNFGVNTYSDWRLPITDPEGSVGYNITINEMGHLFYTELGNTAYGYGAPLNNTGDFQNLQLGSYWSNTASSYYSSYAWKFNTDNGLETYDPMNYTYYGIAVMEGKAIAPEPVSSILFLTGGTLFAARTVRKRGRPEVRS